MGDTAKASGLAVLLSRRGSARVTVASAIVTDGITNPFSNLGMATVPAGACQAGSRLALCNLPSQLGLIVFMRNFRCP